MAFYNNLLGIGSPSPYDVLVNAAKQSPFPYNDRGLVDFVAAESAARNNPTQVVNAVQSQPQNNDSRLTVNNNNDNNNNYYGNSPVDAYAATNESIPQFNYPEYVGDTPQEYAEAYAKAEGQRLAPFKNPLSDFKGLLSDPAKSFNEYINKPTTAPGLLLNAIGIPFGGTLLDKVANYNMTQQAYDRAMAMQGQDGYGYGNIDGQSYSVGPNALGMRAVTGTVPDWFDVDQADALANYEQGLDADGNQTMDVGGARFSPDGYLSTPFGHDVATYDDIVNLSKTLGVSYEEAQNAVQSANSGELDLFDNFDENFADTSDYTGVEGTDMSSDEFEYD